MLVYEQAFHKPPAVDYPRKRSSEKEKVSAVAGSAGVNRPYSFITQWYLRGRSRVSKLLIYPQTTYGPWAQAYVGRSSYKLFTFNCTNNRKQKLWMQSNVPVLYQYSMRQRSLPPWLGAERAINTVRRLFQNTSYAGTVLRKIHINLTQPIDGAGTIEAEP